MDNTSFDKSWNILTCLCFLIVAALASPAIAGETAWETIDLVVDVHDESGHAPLDLAAQDFEVRELGKAAKVIGASPLAGRERPWRVVVYLDPALIRQASQERILGALAERTGELAALGEVEVIQAAAEPRRLLAPTRQPSAIRAALEALVAAPPEREAVSELRQDFLEESAALPSLDELRDRARQSARQEIAILGERLAVLSHWISTQPATGEPTAFLWITEGFDIEIAEFYVRASEGRLRQELEGDLGPYALYGKVEAVVWELLAANWTTMPLTVRGAQHDAPWIDGLQPLRLAAAHTGGVVISHPDGMSRLISNLGRRWVVTYEVAAGAGEGPRRVDVSTRREGLVAHGALWRGSPAKAAELPGTGPSVAKLDAVTP